MFCNQRFGEGAAPPRRRLAPAIAEDRNGELTRLAALELAQAHAGFTQEVFSPHIFEREAVRVRGDVETRGKAKLASSRRNDLFRRVLAADRRNNPPCLIDEDHISRNVRRLIKLTLQARILEVRLENRRRPVSSQKAQSSLSSVVS